ncbi:hypothetical protein REPUB_Repub17cG0062700 [Reevesia pubescens]
MKLYQIWCSCHYQPSFSGHILYKNQLVIRFLLSKSNIKLLQELSIQYPNLWFKVRKMSHQGRCSARQVLVLACTLILLLLFQFEITEAKTFTVGETSGWSFNVQSWAKGKMFKAGDALVLSYDPTLHNVAVVDMDGYNNCSASPSSKVYSSGNDAIKLSKGRNYFICSIPGHCDGGLKIAVDAS